MWIGYKEFPYVLDPLLPLSERKRVELDLNSSSSPRHLLMLIRVLNASSSSLLPPMPSLPLNLPFVILIVTTLLYCSALHQCCYCDGSRFTWEWRSVCFLVRALPLWHLRDLIVDAVSREGGQRRVAIKGRGKRADGIYIYVMLTP